MNAVTGYLLAGYLTLLQQAQSEGVSAGILESVSRIINDDIIAVWVTAILVLIQFVVLLITWTLTLRPLGRARKEIARYRKSKSELEGEDEGRGKMKHKPLRTIHIAIQNARKGTPLDIDHLLDPTRLLPDSYNPRLDAAAPGLFTALGIFGTFFGLMIAFLRVDPTTVAPTTTISPLIGGMVVAFVNSLLGVSLSIGWSYRSRIARHSFDIVCRDLTRAIREESNFPTPEEVAVQRLNVISERIAKQSDHFEKIEQALSRYASETKDSSHRMLQELAPRLEEAFRSITSMPFERLDRIVSSFEEAVEKASDRQLAVGVRLSHVADELHSAEESLVRTVDHAIAVANGFANAIASVQATLEATAVTAEKGREAAASMGHASEELQLTVGTLTSTAQGLRDAQAAITDQAKALDKAATALQEAGNALDIGLGQTVAQTIELVNSSLNASTSTLIEGYKKATESLVDQIDERVTDLTERLSAELATLANRLPAEVQTLNQAANRVRHQIRDAVAKLEEAASRLSEDTPEKLKAILIEFDQALADATDRFSGTLAKWDGHVEQMAGAVEELQRLVSKPATGQLLSSVTAQPES